MSAPRVVLGLDQGQRTGWGIAHERGPVARHGLAKSVQDRIDVVRLLLEIAGGDPARCFVVFEQHDHMPATRLTNADRTTQRKGPRQAAPERSNSSLIGMGKNYGRWEQEVWRSGIAQSHCLEVRPSTWRSRIHGVTKGGDEIVKRAALDWANRMGFVVADHNEAEGMAITAWGAFDGLGTYDADLARKRIERLGERELSRQADLFAPANDNGRRAR